MATYQPRNKHGNEGQCAACHVVDVSYMRDTMWIDDNEVLEFMNPVKNRDSCPCHVQYGGSAALESRLIIQISWCALLHFQYFGHSAREHFSGLKFELF